MERNQITDDYVAITLQRRWGLVSKRKGHEWHSGCPVCGGKDRFWVNQDGHYQCRQCPTSGWLDDDKKNFKPDPILQQKWRDEIQAEKDAQDAKDAEWRSGFKAGYVKGWHDALREVNRSWWWAQRISDHLIDRYQLVYISNKIIIHYMQCKTKTNYNQNK